MQKAGETPPPQPAPSSLLQPNLTNLPQPAVVPAPTSTPAPLEGAQLAEEAAKQLQAEEEARPKLKRRSRSSRIKELENVSTFA